MLQFNSILFNLPFLWCWETDTSFAFPRNCPTSPSMYVTIFQNYFKVLSFAHPLMNFNHQYTCNVRRYKSNATFIMAAITVFLFVICQFNFLWPNVKLAKNIFYLNLSENCFNSF